MIGTPNASSLYGVTILPSVEVYQISLFSISTSGVSLTACETASSIDKPSTASTTFPVLTSGVSFSSIDTVTSQLLPALPLAGDTLIHSSEVVTLQSLFVLKVTVFSEASLEKSSVKDASPPATSIIGCNRSERLNSVQPIAPAMTIANKIRSFFITNMFNLTYYSWVICTQKESVALKLILENRVVGDLADKIRCSSTPISKWIRSEECQQPLCVELPTFDFREYAYTFRVCMSAIRRLQCKYINLFLEIQKKSERTLALKSQWLKANSLIDFLNRYRYSTACCHCYIELRL